MIWSVLNAAQSSVVSPAIDVVDKPAICAVLRAEMMVAMAVFLVLGIQGAGATVRLHAQPPWKSTLPIPSEYRCNEELT